jgi:hypothetical protein
MDFSREALQRVPLAEAVWTLLHYVLDPTELDRLFDEHRGSGWVGSIPFSLLTELIVEALVEQNGSAAESFRSAREEQRLQATDQAVYGKLRRVPIALTQALVRTATRRLRDLAPPSESPAPPSLQAFRVLIVDGKKIKRLPKRLKPLRDRPGSLHGGKAAAGLLLNEGLILAMETSPDGDANEAPLTPGLLDQVVQEDGLPLLLVADRQYADLKIPQQVTERGGQFVIRLNKKLTFHPEKELVSRLPDGREVREAWGYVGRVQDRRRRYVRQITLVRPGAEDVILITSLLDAETYPAADLLDVYLSRWDIERVFQQITEVMHLNRLISSTPQGALFQFGLCAVLYNVIQVLRTLLAAEAPVPAREISSELVFRDVRRQMTAAVTMVPASDLAALWSDPLSVEETRSRLKARLAGVWRSHWRKAPPKKPRPARPRGKTPGNHTSAYKLLKRHAQSKAQEKAQSKARESPR